MNVRWDAVVDRSKMIRSETAETPAPAPAPAPTPDATLTVEIWLFGSLQPANLERPIRLALPAPATAGQVLARLGDIVGPPILSKLVDENGAKRGPCRLFADGHVIDDLDQTIGQGPQPAQIELILLMAAEGG